MISDFYWYLKPNIFHVSILISTFKTIDLRYDSIQNKKRSVKLVKQHEFDYVSIVCFGFLII
jgi:hypothetical protein